MKRVEANDPVALREVGTKRCEREDYKGGFEFFTKAAELGDVEAHYQLMCLYSDGLGVAKDMKKQVYHTEQAAIGGHPSARSNLGIIEWENGRYERAVKHLIIAAKLGLESSLATLKDMYKEGLEVVSKEDVAVTIRAHHAAVNATKSHEREVAEVFRRKHNLV